MRVGLLAGSLALMVTACGESAVEKAQRRYDFVSENGTLGERCAAARKLWEAYFDAKDTENSKLWHLSADVACATAKFEGPSLPANDEARAEIHKKVIRDLDAAISKNGQAMSENDGE